MPRNRPGRLRALADIPPTTPIPGVPMTTCRALDRLGRPDICSQRVAVALKRWRYLSALPRRRLDGDHSDYTAIEAPMVRGELEQALRALPARQSATLRRVVSALDAEFEAKTTHNPHADPSQPWWARRAQH